MTTLVHKSSQPGTKSELDLFYAPATHEQILSGKWIYVHPSGSTDGDLFFLKLKEQMNILILVKQLFV
jgi:hypothetical protein